MITVSLVVKTEQFQCRWDKSCMQAVSKPAVGLSYRSLKNLLKVI